MIEKHLPDSNSNFFLCMAQDDDYDLNGLGVPLFNVSTKLFDGFSQKVNAIDHRGSLERDERCIHSSADEYRYQSGV
jgi:hypothetical protein